jgi:hypothetical protein
LMKTSGLNAKIDCGEIRSIESAEAVTEQSKSRARTAEWARIRKVCAPFMSL